MIRSALLAALTVPRMMALSPMAAAKEIVLRDCVERIAPRAAVKAKLSTKSDCKDKRYTLM